jgi:PAS domain-containing protein
VEETGRFLFCGKIFTGVTFFVLIVTSDKNISAMLITVQHFLRERYGGETVSNPEKEVMDALSEIVKWSRERDVPPGEWAAPLQDVLQGKDMFSISLKQLLWPIAIFDRHGKIEVANDKLLEGTGLTESDIKAGKASLRNIEDFDFSEAVKLALRGETHVVSGLKNPLEYISSKCPLDVPEYMSAIFFSIFDEEAPTRGVVVFLPFDYRPENG